MGEISGPTEAKSLGNIMMTKIITRKRTASGQGTGSFLGLHLCGEAGSQMQG